MPPLTNSRNPNFTTLATVLDTVAGMDAESLLTALFFMRAPWSLQAVVPCCRHLLLLGQQLPALLDPPLSLHQAEQIRLLEVVGSLDEKDLPTSFLKAHVVRRERGEVGFQRPIFGYSGDSGLAELLLMKPPGADRDGKQAMERDLFAQADSPMSPHERAFVFLRAWFARQTLFYQACRMSRRQYDQYLLGDGTERLNQGPGSRLYAASLAIRHLGHPECARQAIMLALAIGSLDDARAVVLFRVFDHLGGGGLQSGDAPSHIDPFLTPLLSEVDWLTPLKERKEPAIPRVDALARWLRLVRGRDEVRDRMGRGHRSFRRDNAEIEIYPDALARTERVSLGEAGSARCVGIFPLPEPAEPPPETVDKLDCQDDPEEEEIGEALVEIYLADGDPTQAYYATKSQVHHIERANAMLLWPFSRLSVRVIRELVARVAQVSSGSAASVVLDRAWLSLGLSLVTGRPLAEVVAVNMQGKTRRAARLAIDLATHTLVAPVPKPDLQGFVWEIDPFPKYCTPWAPTLRLPLPESWWPLVDRLVGKTEHMDKIVVQRAGQLIREMPESWHMTEAGISGALRLAVQEASRDDLALVKVVTDIRAANTRNLIHYSSYPRGEVESLWRRIVERWTGPLPGPTPPLGYPDERVGSPYGMDAAKVRASITEVALHFEDSVTKGDWPAVYNQLAMHTAMWLGLATAGRRACQPVPGVILADGWALIRDKSRPDESTDRYVPLTPALLQQINALRALTHALSLSHPDFALPEPGDDHALTLYTIVVKKGKRGSRRFVVQPFQPKYTDGTVVLRDLPGNWGRKLVRSASPELTGWFKDAGLGHWTQGRHPWTTSSAFPADRFRTQWLAMQGRLEGELGFRVLVVPGLEVSAYEPPIVLPQAPPSLRSKRAEHDREASLSDKDVVEMLGSADPDRLVDAAREQERCNPKAAQDLIRNVLGARAGESREKVRALARRLCRYFREKRSVNVFVSEPHRRFTRNWLVSGYEFRCLAYVESQLLPAIANDLAHLPKRDASPAGEAIDLGRLLVALAWRGGLLNTSHLDGAMAYLAGVGGASLENTAADMDAKNEEGTDEEGGQGEDRASDGAVTDAHGPSATTSPVYAVGDLRLLELRRVPTRRAATSVARTVLLEPYLASLVTVERFALAEPLRAAFTRLASHRMQYWNRVFRAYLASLGLPRAISLSAFLGALRQQLMLHTSPVVAAYASGEVLTYDLPTRMFFQLAGYEPPTDLARPADPSDARDPSADESGLPADLRTPFTEFVHLITCESSDVISHWYDRVSKARTKATVAEQVLFCAFAQHQLSYYYQQGSRHGLDRKQRTTLKENLTVVWEGLVYARFTWGESYVLNEEALEAMSLATEAMFSVRRQHGAWDAFRRFLRDGKRNYAGFVIQGVEARSSLTVNARLLNRNDLDEIASVLGSIRSGIPTHANRQSAARHFALTCAFGTRRAEAEALRWQDVDGELMRIQAYGEHSLKTPAAERILPSVFLAPTVWEELKAGREVGVEKVIDSEPYQPADGSNFYHAVAKVMKRVTGDVNMSHHPVRHTLASALALKLIGEGVDLNRLAVDLPWVAPLLPEDDQVAALLGPGGQGGQGLKAEAVLLGHLHETTTLDHYVHTLGIALYAHILSLPRIPLHVAFQHRAASRATLFRRNKEAEDNGWGLERTDRYVRDTIEYGVTREAPAGSTLLARANVPRTTAAWDVVCSPEAEAWLGKIERWSAELMKPPGADGIDDDMASVRVALQRLAAIPSGKRGAKLPRHAMSERAADGTPMPGVTGGESERGRVATLLTWLLQRKASDPDDYRWLLDKWATASAQDDGSMRLAGEAEIERAQRLATTMGGDLALTIEPAAVSRVRAAKSRRSPEDKPSTPHHRMRIRFTREGPQDENDDELRRGRNHGRRGLLEIRWVLSWAWVECEVAA